MKLYLARRVLSGIVVLWLVTTLVFFILHAIPGDPAQVIAGELADAKTVEQVRASLGLDRPLHVQYLDLIWGVVRGDMDNSFNYKYDALQVVLERLPSTVELTLVAAAFAIPISIFLGRGERRAPQLLVRLCRRRRSPCSAFRPRASGSGS